MAGNILDHIRGKIREQLNEVTDDVALGGCLARDNDVAVEYAKQVGVIEGLARAERVILDVIEAMEEQENLDI